METEQGRKEGRRSECRFCDKRQEKQGLVFIMSVVAKKIWPRFASFSISLLTDGTLYSTKSSSKYFSRESRQQSWPTQRHWRNRCNFGTSVWVISAHLTCLFKISSAANRLNALENPHAECQSALYSCWQSGLRRQKSYHQKAAARAAWNLAKKSAFSMS